MSLNKEDFDEIFDRIDANYNNKTIPSLKNSFKSASNNLTNLIELLVRKSLIKQDTYNYSDGEKNGFVLSPQKNFTEIERPKVMYEKLKELITALDYQATNALNDIDDVDEEFLENSRKILDFISFHNINNPTAEIYTRTMRDLVAKILGGNDQIMTRIMQDILKLLTENFRTIQRLIEELTKFTKEKYKISIRLHVYPLLPNTFSEEAFNQDSATFINNLKEFMKLNASEVNYISHWIMEAIRDCFKVPDDEVIANLSTNFLSASEQKRNEAKANSPREVLLIIVKNISMAKDYLDDIYFRLDQNVKLCMSQKKTFFDSIIEVLKKVLNTGASDEFFYIEYINPMSKKIERDTINIQEFLISIKKQVSLLTQISKPTSPVYFKIKSATEESIFKFVKDTFLNLLLIKERLIGIDGEFRLRYNQKIRSKFKNINEPIEKLNDLLMKIAEQRQKYGSMSHAEEFKKKS